MKTKLSKTAALRSYLRHIAPFKKGLALVGFTFSLSNVLLAVMPILIGMLVDTLANGGDPWTLVILLIAFSSGHDIAWRLSEILFLKFALPLGFSYETLLFRNVIQKPYHYFTDKFTGKVSSYVTNVANEFRWLTSEFFFDYGSQIIGIISVTIILGSINAQTGIVFVVALVAMLIVGRFTLRRANITERVETDVSSSKNGVLIDAISNFASVKAFSTELREIKTIVNEQQKSLKAAKTSYIWGVVFWASMSVFVRHIIWPAVIIMNVLLFVNDQITIGQLATVLSTALIFSTTIWQIVWTVSQLSLKFARINEGYQYLFGDTVVTDSPKQRSASKREMKESLEIKDLSFSYPDKPDRKVLEDISIKIKQGEKIGIVGHSGSGKSTLTKLLLNYYNLSTSHFLVDGSPISSEALAELIAYVPQDTSLFHRTIAENIAYASSDDVDRSSVIEAAKKAQADEFISEIEHGYDALVGERGVKLSGGQRQRIAIARAILKDAPILVLDEATSALDSESELLIKKAFEELWQGKTAIVIAHRLSTIAQLDRIVVMDKGRIAEQGTHSELLKSGGIYAKLWTHQSGGFIED